MKTVKDLAVELKVTPQYINRVINQLPTSKKPKQVNHSYQIDDHVEKLKLVILPRLVTLVPVIMC